MQRHVILWKIMQYTQRLRVFQFSIFLGSVQRQLSEALHTLNPSPCLKSKAPISYNGTSFHSVAGSFTVVLSAFTLSDHRAIFSRAKRRFSAAFSGLGPPLTFAGGGGVISTGLGAAAARGSISIATTMVSERDGGAVAHSCFARGLVISSTFG